MATVENVRRTRGESSASTLRVLKVVTACRAVGMGRSIVLMGLAWWKDERLSYVNIGHKHRAWKFWVDFFILLVLD